MASQVLSWTIEIVRKLKQKRKPSSKTKASSVREASISRPTHRRPSGAYSQRRAEVEPLPYPWAEIDHGRRSAQSSAATTTHHYPHIYYQNGQYHTVQWPPLSSTSSSPSRANSPVMSHKSKEKTVQRSLTYPMGSPHNGRSEVWWAGANQHRVQQLAQQPQHPWNRIDDRHPKCPQSSRSAAVSKHSSLPTRFSHHTHSPKNTTPGPSHLPEIDTRLANRLGRVDENAPRKHLKKDHHQKSQNPNHHLSGRRRAAPPPPTRDPLDFPHGVTPPAFQQHLQLQGAEEEDEFRRRQQEFKPTAQLCDHDGVWIQRFDVDPRDPPANFPFEKYLEMRRAEHERRRRLRLREEEQERQKQALLPPTPSQDSSSRWPVSWFRKITSRLRRNSTSQ